ncbi:MAG: tetratricopeptide repeat protein [Bacteroidota bacterium]
MRKIFMLVLFCIAFFQFCFAQNQQNVDSLLNVLPTTKEDTNRAKLLINLSKIYFQTDPEKCFNYAKQALSLAQKLNYKKCIIRSYQNISIYYVINNDYEKAIAYCQKAVAVAESSNDKEAQCDLSNIMATILSNKGDLTASMKYGLKALGLAEELKDTSRIVTYNVNIAIDYQNTSDYVNSLKYLLKALKLNEIAQNKRAMANTYFIISKNYILAEDDTNLALKYSFLSLNFAREADDQIQVAQSLDLLGTIFCMKKEWEKSLSYFKQTLKKNDELGIATGDWGTNYNIGELYREQGKADEAIEYYLKSLDVGNKTGNVDAIGISYYGLGQVYQIKKNYRQAIDYLHKALSNAQEQSSPAHERETQLALAANYAMIKDYKNAYNYLIEHNRLNDSIVGKEILIKNSDMREKYESEKKEREITVLTKDKEIQIIEIKKQKLLKNSLIAGLALVLILAFFAYNNFRISNKLKLQNIRNRIASDLHDDVGSTLNSISVYSEVAKQKSPAVVHELEEIGDASRKIIDVMSDIVWTINPKNDTFENIILRMSTLSYNLLKAKEIEHTFRADDSLNETKLSLESRRNFYLIFKEVLNNLVKYSNATRVSITLTNENGWIKLAIRDNGIGFDVAQTSKGNGLLNMKARAAEMNAKLKIESEKANGTYIELILKA